MKHLISVVLSLYVFNGTIVFAQTDQNTVKKNQKESSTIPTIKDRDANGIDDAIEVNQSGKKQGIKLRDRFIDANGDGICDNREQGIGFRRGKGQTINQTGKRQQGRQK